MPTLSNSTGLLYSWRTALIFAALIAKFILAVQPSYIHPDEFFQSFQILYHDNLPWEVKDKENINRSIVPLLITHYPVIWIGTKIGLNYFQIYLLVRIQLTIISWIVTDWCLYRLAPMKHERIKATLFTMTSYLTLVHQTHTFSNSTETCFLLPTLFIINDIRSYLERNVPGQKYSTLKLAILGILISLGIFNRITFPAWIILPSFYLFKFFLKYPFMSLIPILVCLFMSSLFILIDTAYYQSSPKYTIAPLNNLMYNLSTDNLSLHGIHSRYTHILINYPQMVGPLLFLIFPFTMTYTRTTIFLAVLSGFVILSAFPHQELRFLLPAVPLLSTLISFSNPTFSVLKRYFKIAFTLWLVFTSIMSVFYGFFHQVGVVPAIAEINQNVLPASTTSTTLLFWRTYPPPTWMIEKKFFSDPSYISKQDDGTVPLDTPQCDQNYVIDLMGSSLETLHEVREKFRLSCTNNQLFLVTPANAILNIEPSLYDTIWTTFWHLDMDHFEYDLHGLSTFTPGLSVCRLL